MTLAIQEALKGEGFVHPNPMVGAVIVKDDKILCKGFHHNYGNLHAERDALHNAALNGIDVKGAELYVTLEPCCHTGKQPPCTDAIIKSGISKVYIGSRDPNPLVNGKGVKLLEDAGITVVQDVLKEECDAINKIFFHYIQNKIPYTILKYAMTADGKIATSTGKSRWISNEKSRLNVHRTRANVMAVLTSIGTVLKDDPMLNVRLNDNAEHFCPMRAVCDTSLRIPLDCKLVSTAVTYKTVVFCSEEAYRTNTKKISLLNNSGVSVYAIKKDPHNHVSVADAVSYLGTLGADSVLIEAGSNFNGAAAFARYNDNRPLVNEVQLYIAPKLFSSDGKTVYSPLSSNGISEVSEALKLEKIEIKTFDEDIFISYRVNKDNFSTEYKD